MINLKIKNEGILNFIIIVLVALGVLAPISSNQFMPNITDFVSHSGLIVQAKKALFTGDFPIRVAPWQHSGYAYPEFQFYSPFPFTIAAIVYGVLFSFNVYLALKVMFFLIMVFAGIYTYRLGVLMTQSKEIGILMAVSYIVSPYFLLNILARSAFTEAFAQGIIPCCLFYSFKFFKENTSVKAFLLVALSWFMMVTSHLISFINFSLFMGILVFGMRMLRLVSFKRVMLYGASYLYAIFLSAWFIAPIALFHNHLNINHDVSNIIDSNWLTPLSELFSFQSVSMIPLPGNGLLNSEIYPSLGWISILSVIGVWYGVSHHHKKKLMFDKGFAYLLLGLYFLALILAWSPINFWYILPQFLQASQFTYRFLAQSMWVGSMLFGLFLSLYFKEKNIFYVLIGVLFILNLNGSWIHTLVSRDLKPSSIATNPDIGYGAVDYLYEFIKPAVQLTNTQLPLLYPDGWLITDKAIDLDNQLFQNNRDLQLNLKGINPLQTKPNLTILLNDKVVKKVNISPGPFHLQIPLNLGKIQNKSTSQMKLISSQFLEPIENGKKTRKLSLKIDSIYFFNAGHGSKVMGAEEVKEHCLLKKWNHQTNCDIDIPQSVSVIQLPFLYYPQMLTIKVDGLSIGQNYIPSNCNQFQCVTFAIQQGKHRIQYKFTGLSWANHISLIAWLFFMIFLRKKIDFNLLKNKLLCQRLLKGFINVI